MKIRLLCVEHNADLIKVSKEPLLVMDEDDLSWDFDFSPLDCPIGYDEDDSCRTHVGAWRVVLE